MEFFQHYILFNKNNNIEISDIIVHLRPTTPLRDILVLDKGIELLLHSDEATSLRSVYPIPISPYKDFKIEGSYLKGFFPQYPNKEYYNLPRQEFPQTYIPNGYVDIIKTSTLESESLHGDKLMGYIVDIAPDIDTQEVFTKAEESLLDQRFSSLINEIERLHDRFKRIL